MITQSSINKLYHVHLPQSISVKTINGFIKMGYNTVCFSDNTCRKSLTGSSSIIVRFIRLLTTSIITEAIEYIHYHVYFLPARKLSTNNPPYTLYTVHELKMIPILPAQSVLSSKLDSPMRNVKMLLKRLLNELQFTDCKQSEHFLPC